MTIPDRVTAEWVSTLGEAERRPLRPAPSRPRTGPRPVRAMLAGLVGAVGAGYGLVLLDPSARTDRLATGLAGALWLSGIVEV